jgi:mono/diheme cytochrome c family protein
MSAATRVLAVLGALLVSQARAAEDAIAGRAQAILEKHCSQCHGRGGSSKGGFGYVLDREQLIGRALVVPGKPDDSELYRKVHAREMPPGKAPRPEAGEVAVLRDWILAGAPAFGKSVRPIAVADVPRLILQDLEFSAPRQRRFLRYVSFTHLAEAGRLAADLDVAGQALSKLLNSLSWHPRVSKPTPIDPGRTMYRIDLRDYRWTARTWDRLIVSYPYRLAPNGAAARSCADLTGSDGFLVRGDWLIATASRGKLYYDLLEMPSTDKGVERLLQVDAARDIQEETALRTGFNGSGVARNNRVLQRHDALHGAYWRSFDFSENTGRQNIFENPVGPAAGRHSFRPAGGEAIFHLPNGFQAYLLVNAEGKRVDKAPVEIVSDPLRPDRQVEAGLSCMTCHARGLIPKEDQVRAHVEKNTAVFPRDVIDAVRALHPPARRLRALLDTDNKRYLAALDVAGIAAEGPEPVSTITLRYEGVADLAAAASELGLRSEELSRRLAASASLQRLLGPLQARGGTVQRQVIEENFARIAGDLGTTVAAIEKIEPMRKPVAAQAFVGHTDAVLCLALSADGRLALSGGKDQSVRLWDVVSGKMLHNLEGHADEVNGVAFSPDGKRVLSCGSDRTVRVWSVESGKEVARLKGHLDRVRAVVFSPDGKRVLSASPDRTIRLWDVGTGEELRVLSGHGGTVNCVAFSPDGKLAISGGADGSIRVWEIETGREKERWDAHRRGVSCVAFSPDGKHAVSGGEDRVVRIWEVAGGREVRSLTGHVNALLSVGFSTDGRRVFSASGQHETEDRFLRIWDVDTGKELAGRGGPGSVWCAAFTPDLKLALTGGTEKRLQRWSLSER